MTLSRVTGSIVSTRKSEKFQGKRLLLVTPIQENGTLIDGASEWVALDAGVDAGVGDVVLVVKEGLAVNDLFDDGNLDSPRTPANVVIVGVVDNWAISEADRGAGK